jgi:hypothetical protein
MGMFDTVKCEFPLPEKFNKYQDSLFQTKSLICAMDVYKITKEGQLWWVDNQFSDDDEDEPKKPPERIDLTGELRFYEWNLQTNEWTQFVALFIDGKMIYLDEDKKASNV